MTVFLVRHAHAGEREDWRGDDRERPLSEKGWAQARGLVAQLEGEPVTRLLSSPYLRCRQTLEPLAEARGLSVEGAPALAEGSDWHEALEMIETATAPAALCSQGDVIGDLVMHLVGAGVVASGDARWQKGSTWAIEVHENEIRGARYIEPPGRS